MTRALGIKLGRVRFLVFGIGAALAGLGGILSGPISQVSPDMGSVPSSRHSWSS